MAHSGSVGFGQAGFKGVLRPVRNAPGGLQALGEHVEAIGIVSSEVRPHHRREDQRVGPTGRTASPVVGGPVPRRAQLQPHPRLARLRHHDRFAGRQRQLNLFPRLILPTEQGRAGDGDMGNRGGTGIADLVAPVGRGPSIRRGVARVIDDPVGVLEAALPHRHPVEILIAGLDTVAKDQIGWGRRRRAGPDRMPPRPRRGAAPWPSPQRAGRSPPRAPGGRTAASR